MGWIILNAEPNAGTFITNNVTTAESIRDRIITVIGALTPKLMIGDRFVKFGDDREGDFRQWAVAVQNGCLRRFEVRYSEDDATPDMSLGDVEAHLVTMTVMLAYPQTHRYGKDNARDRDDLINADRHQIQLAIGMTGKDNFTDPYPNATWISEKPPVRDGGLGVEFLTLELTYRYWRRMVP